MMARSRPNCLISRSGSRPMTSLGAVRGRMHAISGSSGSSALHSDLFLLAQPDRTLVCQDRARRHCARRVHVGLRLAQKAHEVHPALQQRAKDSKVALLRSYASHYSQFSRYSPLVGSVGTRELTAFAVTTSVFSPPAQPGQPYTTDFRPSIRVFTGLTIVSCGRTLWLARNEGRFLPAPTSTLQCGPSAICPEHRLDFWDSRYHPDEAGDKRRVQKPLIFKVKLMRALGTERTNQQSRNET